MVEVARQLETKQQSPVVHDYDAMLARARDLVPRLRERAAATEDMRRLPAETERDLHDSGLFRILQPRRVGGSEFDYVALVDFAEEIARGDASVAWNLGNLGSHHWMLGMFPEYAQNEIWRRDPDTLIASSFIFPAGRATRVDGGYRLKGHWPFCSGVDPSQWSMLGGLVRDSEDAPPEYRIFLVHRRDYKIIDTWDVAGLRGTGSNDVEIDDLFVPQEMTLAVADIGGGPTPGSTVNPSPLYKLPVFALFAFVLSGAALGNAQACLDDYVAETRKRASRYNLNQLAGLQSVQIKVGAASARIDAARLLMRTTCIDAMLDAAHGRIPDMQERTRYRRDGAFSVNLCTEAVTDIFKASGGGGLAKGRPLERQFRDAYGVNAHIAFSFDMAGSNYGRVAFGLPSENPTL